MEIAKGSSFPLGSDYIGSSNCFKNTADILVYVEGFEDVSFWNKFFSKADISVNVQAYGNKNKANGKGTILSACDKKDIELGKNLLIAIDSDYDYLLENNTSVFSSDFSFQTYAFSIENLIWHAEAIGTICQDACNNTDFINVPHIKNGIEAWSKVIYPEFLRFLFSDAKDEKCFEGIMETLRTDSADFDFSEVQFADFHNVEFEEKMKAKGLDAHNVYLFVRGHDFADRVVALCKTIVETVCDLVKQDLRDIHGENANQFIGEFYGKRKEPDAVARGRDIKCDFSSPLIMKDISNFKAKHLSKPQSVFGQVRM